MRLILFISLLLISSLLYGQSCPSRVNIGLNLVPLYAGTPELQLDFYPIRYLGISANTGYTYKAERGYTRINDGAELHKLDGYYYKIGIKGRTLPQKKIWAPVFWAQLFYVGSNYKETGLPQGHLWEDRVDTVISGFVDGVALSAGVDIKVIYRFDVRVGFQIGYYERNNHLGLPFSTYQPGFGSEAIFLNNQLIISAVYKFGNCNINLFSPRHKKRR